MGAIEPGPVGASLEGGEWVVAEHLGADGRLTPVPADIRPTVHFVAGRVAGSTGCNRYTGIYEAADGSLTIHQVAATLMACTPEADAVERAVLAALDAAAAYEHGGDRLSLTDADGREVLLLRASSLTLVGANWSAIGINNQRGGVVSLVIGTTVRARFGDDGQLAGTGGCNRIFGPYEIDGEAIRIGPLASGRMMCTEPEGAMEQEAAYLAALQAASTWSITDGRLQLRDAEGALQVDFHPADESSSEDPPIAE